MMIRQLLNKCWATILLIFIIGGQTSAQLVINEISASNSNVIFDEDGDSPDWIEIQNISDAAVQLSSFSISDDPEELDKFALPEYLLQPGEFLLLFASDKNRTGGAVYWETVIRENDETKYIVPQSAVSTQWTLPNFIDNSWQSGTFGIGYGDEDDATQIAAGSMSVFTRTMFTVDDTSSIYDLKFHIDYDDAYIAFLNGEEISRANITGANPIPFDQGADNFTEPRLVFGEDLPTINLKNKLDHLLDGENVLAIQVHNFNQSSSDLTLIPFLSVGYNQQPQNARGVADPTRLQNIQIDFPHTISNSAHKVNRLF